MLPVAVRDWLLDSDLVNRVAVPFTPVIRGDNKQAEQAAGQLNALIANRAAEGWAFVGLESVTSLRPSGSLGFSPPQVLTVQLAIFEDRGR